MKVQFLTVIASACLLSACTMTPEECDPSIGDPSLLNKMGCVFSGSYEQRVEDKKADIAALKAEQQALAAQSEALLKESSLVHAKYEQKRKNLDKLNQDLSAMQQRLAQKQSLNSSLKKKFDNAQAQINNMRNTPDNASILQKQQEYETLQREVAELNDALGGSM